MVSLLAQSADEQLLTVEIVFEIGHESATGHVRISPFAADVLSDPVDHQNIDMIKFHAGQTALCDLQQSMVALPDLFRRVCLDLRDPVVGVLHHADAHNDGHL